VPVEPNCGCSNLTIIVPEYLGINMTTRPSRKAQTGMRPWVVTYSLLPVGVSNSNMNRYDADQISVTITCLPKEYNTTISG